MSLDSWDPVCSDTQVVEQNPITNMITGSAGIAELAVFHPVRNNESRVSTVG